MTAIADNHNVMTSFGSVGLSMVKGVALFLYPIRYVALGLFILILTDLHFGIRVAKKKGIEIRKSRAFRRTANKTMDYLCLILLASFIQQLFDCSKITFPYFSLIFFFFIGFFELESIINNYLALHDRGGISLFKLFKAFFKGKNKTADNIINEIEKEEDEDKDNK